MTKKEKIKAFLSNKENGVLVLLIAISILLVIGLGGEAVYLRFYPHSYTLTIMDGNKLISRYTKLKEVTNYQGTFHIVDSAGKKHIVCPAYMYTTTVDEK